MDENPKSLGPSLLDQTVQMSVVVRSPPSTWICTCGYHLRFFKNQDSVKSSSSIPVKFHLRGYRSYPIPEQNTQHVGCGNLV
eukprot:scaffold3254_cov140-Skeletonema_menzelii.AAC.4